MFLKFKYLKHFFSTISVISFGIFALIIPLSCEKEAAVEDTFASLEVVTDVEGNEYKTVTIYNQTWFAENLKTTLLNDGTPILHAEDSAAWVSTDTAAYCWYANSPELYKADYGALYNWYAVKNEKLCPVGWKVPKETDWKRLIDSLKGTSVAGGKMKHAGSQYWTATNTGATNSSGFRALPGGYRNIASEFRFIRDYGFWWSATTFDENSAWYHHLYYYSPRSYRNHFKFNMGYSVRCVKEESK
jgi:uncharacterized protein (TIGR02145 family)